MSPDAPVTTTGAQTPVTAPESPDALVATTGAQAAATAAGPGRVLVIGYGNSLRSDDGVGWHVAMRLCDDPRLTACEVLARHQLTPELALDLGEASLVILIDADVGVAPGAISVRRLTGEPGARNGARGMGTIDRSPSTHHVDAGELLALAGELGGHVPEAVVIGVGVADLELGESLSPAVGAALPDVADLVLGLVADHQGR